jgi:hypothetical protein
MRLTRAVAFALAATSVAACSDTTDPTTNGDTTPITVDLCASAAFGWFAYQNQGGPWTQITPNSNGQLAFDATDKVSVAVSISFFGSSVTQIINASAAELDAVASGVSCDGLFGDRTISGTIAGVTGEQFVRITAGESIESASPSDPNWILEDLPSTALDIVATRFNTPFTQPASRAFVRRGVVPQNGTTPALDFNSATESGALDVQTVTLAGGGSAMYFVGTTVITGNGTEHELGELDGFSSGSSFTYVSLPSNLRVATDQHILSAVASSVDGVLAVDHYYKTPGAKTLTFGPMVPMPTITTAASTPYVRPRTQVASQAEYPTAIQVDFTESTGEISSRIIGIITTAAFAGGLPQTWDVTMPDMSAAGFPSASGLQGTDYHWNVTAHSTSTPGILLGGTPPDGSTHTSATRTNIEEFGASPRAARSRSNVLSRAGVARYGVRPSQP